MYRRLLVAVLLSLASVAHAHPHPSLAVTIPELSDNPLLAKWDTPFGVPPFERFRPEHFLPAFHAAIERHDQEIAAIANSEEPATFANTIAALDASGRLLARVNAVFSNLTSAETNDSLQAIARETAPLLASHTDDVNLNPAVFRRVKAVWEKRVSLGLEPDQDRLLERTWKTFVRGGAMLPPAKQKRLRALNSELASLSQKFGDNLLKEMNSYKLVIDDRAQLAGLPDRVVFGAAEAAKQAGLAGKWVFTLHAPSVWPFLQNAENRELRRQIFTAYTERANHGDGTDNKAVLARTAALRAERAKLLGYATHADFVLEEQMAKTPAQVNGLLDRLWPAAKAAAAREAAALQDAFRADGNDGTLQPWDWFYYAEKVRAAKYAVDEDALRPYFRLENVRDGAFRVANRLYGVTITPLDRMPVYHPEVNAWEVKDADGSHLAVFYTDFHPRPGKRGGAWSSRYRDTWVDADGAVRPVVVNVCNFSRPAGDAPALLSLEETETLFHEFGHALHSILSRVRYRTIATTPRDFVEMPSQIMENWALEPEVLKEYARHWQTGEVIPADLVERVRKSRKFNQGFATVEYLAASLLDMQWHTLASTKPVDPVAFEKAALGKIGMPAEIVPRYRSTYFQHIFAGGYSSGYYSYVWSEVLDADAYEAFKEKGIFDAATATAFRTRILERGGSEDAMIMYVKFRGREPSVEPLLERRGLKGGESAAGAP